MSTIGGQSASISPYIANPQGPHQCSPCGILQREKSSMKRTMAPMHGLEEALSLFGRRERRIAERAARRKVAEIMIGADRRAAEQVGREIGGPWIGIGDRSLLDMPRDRAADAASSPSRTRRHDPCRPARDSRSSAIASRASWK